MRNRVPSGSGDQSKSGPTKTVSRRSVIATGASALAAVLSVGVKSSPASSIGRVLAPAPSVPSIAGSWTTDVVCDAAAVRLNFPDASANSKDGSVFLLATTANSGRATAAARIGKTAFRYQSIVLAAGSAKVVSFSRPAGTFQLIGFDGRQRSGVVRFVPSSDFPIRLRAANLAISSREQLQLSLTGATVDDVRLTKAAFPDADATTIGFLNMSGQGGAGAVAFKQLLPTMTARDVMPLLAQNVTPKYVLELRQSGLSELTPTDVANLKGARIGGSFVRAQSVGGRIPSVSELLQAKAAMRAK